MSSISTTIAKLTIEEYLSTIGHTPRKGSRYPNRLLYFCPLHEEHTPSFNVDCEKQLWICRGGCHDGGTLPYLITLKEGVPFWKAYEIAGIARPQKEEQQRTYTIYQSPRQDYATKADRILLTAAMLWWHRRLFDKTTQAAQARNYLLERGISHITLSLPQIGYAPLDRDGSLAASLTSWIEQQCATQVPDWQERILTLGLFLREHPERMRLQGRVTFSCTFPQEGWKECWYTQGRSVPPRESRYKYLGLSGIRKVPFTLPLLYQDIPVTLGVESPFGPAVLAGYGGPALATLGEGIDQFFLQRFLPPFAWAQDNDEPRAVTKAGTTTSIQPGEVQAQICLQICASLGLPAFRLEPPRSTKGVDEWIRQQQSIMPLIEQMKREQEILLPPDWHVSPF